MHNLMRNVQIAQRTSAVAVSNTSTDHTGAAIDMKGYEGVAFLGLINGTPTSTTWNIHVEQSASSGMTDAVDISGSAVWMTTGIANGVVAVDVYRPLQRYVRYVMDRATTDDAFDGVVALLYNPSVAPVTHSTSKVYDVEYFSYPSSGSAT